ncbi:glycosyl transferase [Streptosporangium carneum]|uniref:Glycosyl transferase n=2 Tax=Streptosporangium carneum TaxID=47481 RepID=A0A9W6MGM2_9ACTN|nr:glycosyl transferase [Streptosporangium carneum]
MVSEHASPLATVGGADSGGQNVHVAALSLALAASGHEITVYTRRESPLQPERVAFAPGVTVVHVPAGPAVVLPKDDLLAWMPDFSRWLALSWGAAPPDIAHSHFWMSGLATLAAARDTGVPVVHTFHALGTVKRRHQGSADTSPRERVDTEALIARQVDTVIATCADEVAELRRMRLPDHATRVVPCGVDVDVFTPAGPRTDLGPGPILLAVGRAVPRKGVETTIRALRHVPDATLVVAGGGPGEPELDRLARIAGMYGVADRVRFVGRVAREDVPALMRSADVVVSVPWYEPFGIVPLEAMACGVPVVASAVGGHLDTVTPGVTGLLIPPRKAAVLGRALRELLADPFLLTSYGTAAADRARSHYDWNRVAAQTAAVYGDVLASYGRALSMTGTCPGTGAA